MKGAIFINTRRLFCLVLAFAVICCVQFSTSAYAATSEFFSYNGTVYPVIPVLLEKYTLMLANEGEVYLYYTSSPLQFDDPDNVPFGTLVGSVFHFSSNSWVKVPEIMQFGYRIVWSNYDVYSKAGDLVFRGTVPMPLPVEVSDISPVWNSLVDQISVSMVIGILAGLAGVSVVLVFMWWGVRKVSGSLMKAFKKGKIRI